MPKISDIRDRLPTELVWETLPTVPHEQLPVLGVFEDGDGSLRWTKAYRTKAENPIEDYDIWRSDETEAELPDPIAWAKVRINEWNRK